MKAAYRFPRGEYAGKGQTIAVVVAFHDAAAEQSLFRFSVEFDLPLCTVRNGCFNQVDQNGGTNYPGSSDPGWASEADLDIEWAHAIAPGARIVLVEADDASAHNLLSHAEDTASRLARYVSNSWVVPEFSTENTFDHHFTDFPGVSYFYSSGDTTIPYYPSVSPYVVSVGGTVLVAKAGGKYDHETAWPDAGGGCSQYEQASTAQAAYAGYAQVGCNGYRATPDLSLVATGLDVYTVQDGQAGWGIFHGTSLSTPMVAARAADTGAVVDQAYLYGNAIAFRDVTQGASAGPCLVGYDLCSGRGTWYGPTP